ncbi:MAG: cell filamentation protein Fic, partial [Dysgonamonadaceae bacterium]|nr:cell filamentation protein Fic [Dysgonamonadaceae bacterium]
MSKISIRFFNNREVRAVWDEGNNKWWFSVVDIVGILNEEDNYVKAGNYWRWLKRKLLKEQNQPVSSTHGLKENIQFVNATHKLKLTAPDSKKRLTDVMDSDGIIALAKHFPNNRAMKFLDWFLYSENTIDGQSRKKA